MPKQIYSRVWIHLLWSTFNQKRLLYRDVRLVLSQYLYQLSKSYGIFLRSRYIHDNHVHVLFDLPMNKDIHNIHALYKSQSESYLQGQGLVEDVVWDKGYTAFSLSHSQLEDIMHFFANQYTYHKKNSFAVEHRMLLKLYQIERSFMST